MSKQKYYAIKVLDLLDSTQNDFKTWEVIYIEAFNYHEAKNILKKMNLFDDYHLIPNSVLRHRDIVKGG